MKDVFVAFKTTYSIIYSSLLHVKKPEPKLKKQILLKEYELYVINI